MRQFKEILENAKNYYRVNHKIEGPKYAKSFFNDLAKSQSLPLWAAIWEEDTRYYEIQVTLKDWDSIKVEFITYEAIHSKDGEIESYNPITNKEILLDLWEWRHDDYKMFNQLLSAIEDNLK